MSKPRSAFSRRGSIRHGEREDLLAKFAEGIGEPEEAAFRPSPFQEEAVEAILDGDVIVVAPTGSGKTWIAEQVIRHYLASGLSSWYTTPLKALSNQKFEQFKKLYGAEQVGLLTGERRENGAAPLVVATTEVLRNALYEGPRAPALAVLDEAHYLGDKDRGTTWEEIIILASVETHLLLLSATVSNAGELAEWMSGLRGQRPRIVAADGRPVPLRYGFLDRRTNLWPLQPRVAAAMRPRDLNVEFNPVRAVKTLGEHDLLPAIVFLPRRRDCDMAASMFGGDRLGGKEARVRLFRELAGDMPHLWGHLLVNSLLESGVASHHAGHLTGWKIVVEHMLAEGLVRAVFATTTLAAGLDVPARTVLLPTLNVRDDKGIRPLSALEFHQMTGRAGRRGKDKVGFVIVAPEHHKDLSLVQTLAGAEPEALRSAFGLSYYQVLNLLHRFGPDGALDFLDSSFYLFQHGGKRARRSLRTGFGLRLSLLHARGYLKRDQTLSEAGRWGLLLRHERSLVVMEMVRRGLWQGLTPPELAGWIGAIIGSRAPWKLAAPIALSSLEALVDEVEKLEDRMGIEPLGLGDEFRPDHPGAFKRGRPGEAWRRAAAVALWASGQSWESIVERADTEEGDLQRLVLQSAEALREMEELPIPQLASAAHEARLAMLRDPVM